MQLEEFEFMCKIASPVTIPNDTFLYSNVVRCDCFSTIASEVKSVVASFHLEQIETSASVGMLSVNGNS